MASSKKQAGSKAKAGVRKSTGTKKATSSQQPADTKNAAGAKKAAAKKATENVLTLVSFAKQIAPLFRTIDVQCMRARGVFLKNYDYMKDGDQEGDNAKAVLEMLKPDADPRMPYGGPYWTDANIQLLQDWINDGLPP
jgi:hypothetical protein